MNATFAARTTLSERSRKNLVNAMQGEAFEYAKYKLFAEHARSSGRAGLAELFDKIADQKFFEHFTRLAQILGLVGSDEQDVNHAIAAESFEVDTVYKRYVAEAREDGDEELAHVFEEIRHDEAVHQLAFEEALIELQTRDRIMRSGTRSNSKAHVG